MVVIDLVVIVTLVAFIVNRLMAVRKIRSEIKKLEQEIRCLKS